MLIIRYINILYNIIPAERQNIVSIIYLLRSSKYILYRDEYTCCESTMKRTYSYFILRNFNARVHLRSKRPNFTPTIGVSFYIK